MPVDTKHPAYTKYIEKWERCRDTVAGEDAVKSKGSTYLPKLSAMDDNDYEAYKKRAGFFGGSGRTVDAFVGMIFRNPMEVEFQESQKDLLEHITKDARALQTFAQETVREVVTTSRWGILVDADVSGEYPPYLVGYCAESIWNWKTRMVEGRMILSMVTLCEEANNVTNDHYQHETYRRLRVLQLDEAGIYRVEVWKEIKNPLPNGSRWILEEASTPMIRGVPFKYIPFVIVGAADLTPAIDDPVLLDLVNTNLSLYRTQADVEHGRHFTALPTPWAAGFDIKNELKLGSSKAWVTDQVGAQAGFLEFTGQGLAALENAVKEKKEEMAILGVRMLETDKLAAEAADTTRLKKSGEASVLSSIAHTCSAGLSMALTWLTDWIGGTEQPIVKLNQDFTDFAIDPSMIQTLMSAVQGGTLSWETFFYNLKRGHVIPDGVDAEKEKALIRKGLINEVVPLAENGTPTGEEDNAPIGEE